jgi:predicted solute-binding protein
LTKQTPRKEIMRESYEHAFLESCRYGLAHMDDIVKQEAATRGFSEELVRQYLTRHIVFELGPRDIQGMELYLKHALALEEAIV